MAPALPEASSSMTGPTMRHGPHQGAHMSTMTGTSAFSTCSSNSLSVTSGTFDMGPSFRDCSQWPL